MAVKSVPGDKLFLKAKLGRKTSEMGFITWAELTNISSFSPAPPSVPRCKIS